MDLKAKFLVVDYAGLITLSGKGYLEGPGSNPAKSGAGHGGIGGKGAATGKHTGKHKTICVIIMQYKFSIKK